MRNRHRVNNCTTVNNNNSKRSDSMDDSGLELAAGENINSSPKHRSSNNNNKTSGAITAATATPPQPATSSSALLSLAETTTTTINRNVRADSGSGDDKSNSAGSPTSVIAFQPAVLHSGRNESNSSTSTSSSSTATTTPLSVLASSSTEAAPGRITPQRHTRASESSSTTATGGNNRDQHTPQPAGTAGGGGAYDQYQTFLKVLVPSIAAGAVIGKRGESIAQLQEESGTRIKMSKDKDFYPGTAERVCMIFGPSPEAIMKAYDVISQKMHDKPDARAQEAIDFDTKQAYEREKQIKILVPNSTAGMIIGRQGSYIKYIKDESGAYLQLSQKASAEQPIPERCITVMGEPEALKPALQLILKKIFEDQHSTTCPNLSYANVVGPVPNFNPTGSPYAGGVSGTGGGGTSGVPGGMGSSPADQMMSHGPGAGGSFGGGGGGVGGGGPFGPYHSHHISPQVGMAAVAAAAAAASAADPGAVLMQWRHALRLSGFNEQAVGDVIGALHTLLQYGLILPNAGGNGCGSSIALGGYNTNWMLNWPSGVTRLPFFPASQGPQSQLAAIAAAAAAAGQHQQMQHQHAFQHQLQAQHHHQQQMAAAAAAAGAASGAGMTPVAPSAAGAGGGGQLVLPPTSPSLPPHASFMHHHQSAPPPPHSVAAALHAAHQHHAYQHHQQQQQQQQQQYPVAAVAAAAAAAAVAQGLSPLTAADAMHHAHQQHAATAGGGGMSSYHHAAGLSPASPHFQTAQYQQQHYFRAHQQQGRGNVPPSTANISSLHSMQQPSRFGGGGVGVNHGGEPASNTAPYTTADHHHAGGVSGENPNNNNNNNRGFGMWSQQGSGAGTYGGATGASATTQYRPSTQVSQQHQMTPASGGNNSKMTGESAYSASHHSHQPATPVSRGNNNNNNSASSGK